MTLGTRLVIDQSRRRTGASLRARRGGSLLAEKFKFCFMVLRLTIPKKKKLLSPA